MQPTFRLRRLDATLEHHVPMGNKKEPRKREHPPCRYKGFNVEVYSNLVIGEQLAHNL